MAIVYNNSTVTVAATTTEIVGHRETRQLLSITNISLNPISISLNDPAVVNAGKVLQPNETLFFTEVDHVNEPINGIAGVNSDVAILERYLDAV